MTYDLAEKLREAGFPNIEIRGGDGKLPCGADSCFHNHDRIPTLSELIEACGDGFVTLADFGINEGTNIRWRVCGKDNIGNCSGATPEEAVCLLYLKLNEK